MSDPAKSPAEIEDVLSSIRRLVSEHQSPPAAAPAPAADAAVETDDRLVLTPALRVTDPDDPWAPVPTVEPASDEAVPEPAAVFRRSSHVNGTNSDAAPTQTDDSPEEEDRHEGWMSDTVTGAEQQSGVPEEPAPEAEFGAEAEPETEAAPEIAAELTDAEVEAAVLEVLDAAEEADRAEMALMDGEIPEPVADSFEPEAGDTDWPDSQADLAVRDLAAMRGGHAPENEPEAERSQDADDIPEPAIEETAEAAADETQTMEVLEMDTTPDTPTPGAEDCATDTVTETDGATPIFARDPGQREAESLETVDVIDVDAEAPNPEPQDAGSADEDSGDAPDGDAEVEDLGETRSPFTFPEQDDDTVLDEDTLREMIVDIVREELQGALGQRITRNVRKMVRREIRIALAAEDLE